MYRIFKKEIMEKINSYFGYKLINEIKFQTSNSEKCRKTKKKRDCISSIQKF